LNGNFLYFIKYFAVAVITTLVYWTILFALNEEIGYLGSAIVGYIAGFLVNYYLCCKYVFLNGNGIKKFNIYIIVFVSALGLNELILYIVHGIMHYSLGIAGLSGTIIGFFWNYSARYIYEIISFNYGIAKEQ